MWMVHIIGTMSAAHCRMTSGIMLLLISAYMYVCSYVCVYYVTTDIANTLVNGIPTIIHALLGSKFLSAVSALGVLLRCP